MEDEQRYCVVCDAILRQDEENHCAVHGRPTRFAVVQNARDAKQLRSYLPENYAILGPDFGDPGRPVYLISGRDSAGWTLDDYVIPRLASGLIWATEITNEVTKAIEEVTGR
jgi:hypothetical protein